MKYHDWLVEHPDFETEFIDLGDGLAITKRRNQEIAMKTVAELKDLCLLENTKVDGWIVNVFGLSCYYDRLYSLKEIESIEKQG